jgi:hypothetical protein
MHQLDADHELHDIDRGAGLDSSPDMCICIGRKRHAAILQSPNSIMRNRPGNDRPKEKKSSAITASDVVTEGKTMMGSFEKKEGEPKRNRTA